LSSTPRIEVFVSAATDNLDPEFVTPFQMTYFFEEQQTVVVKIYDEDVKGSRDLSRHDFMGEVSFNLGALIASPGECFSVSLYRSSRYLPSGIRSSSTGQTMTIPFGKHRSSVTIRAEELSYCRCVYGRFVVDGIDE
jgi:hypothetical protein